MRSDILKGDRLLHISFYIISVISLVLLFLIYLSVRELDSDVGNLLEASQEGARIGQS